MADISKIKDTNGTTYNIKDSTARSDISGKAPTDHKSSTASTYGAGNGSYFGHVKLTDTYDTVSTSQKAANSIAGSAWALQKAYDDLLTKNNRLLSNAEITATDLNDDSTLTQGLWSYGSSVSNKPNSAGGTLFVIKKSSYMIQFAIPNSTSQSFQLYARIRYRSSSSAWPSWSKIFG